MIVIFVFRSRLLLSSENAASGYDGLCVDEFKSIEFHGGLKIIIEL